jgi:hypothetical protein
MNRCYHLRAIGSSGAPSTSLSHWDPLTQLIRHIYRRSSHLGVGSSGVEGFLAKTLLLAFSRSSDEPLLHLRFIRCYCSSLDASLSRFKLTLDRPTVKPIDPSVHLVLLSSALCFFLSFDACRMGTASSSDGAKLIPALSVPSAPTLLPRVLSVHSTVSFLCFLAFLTWFFASFDCGCIYGI